VQPVKADGGTQAGTTLSDVDRAGRDASFVRPAFAHLIDG
jgi:hypothetical protein